MAGDRQNALAGDGRRRVAASALGQSIRVNDRPLTIIRVTPERFQGTGLGLNFDLWVPATAAPMLLGGSRELEDRGLRGYNVIGRLRPDVSLVQAHIVFDDLRRRAPVPMISIVEATCEAAMALQLARVGLFGTQFTMQGRFYRDVFAGRGIAVVVPDVDDQRYIHDKYMGELVNGIMRPETRDELVAIAARLRDRQHVEGLILGGTELPLILRDAPSPGIPFLDTTMIHVRSIVAAMLS